MADFFLKKSIMPALSSIVLKKILKMDIWRYNSCITVFGNGRSFIGIVYSVFAAFNLVRGRHITNDSEATEELWWNGYVTQ
jgi:hypothetical protein